MSVTPVLFSEVVGEEDLALPTSSFPASGQFLNHNYLRLFRTDFGFFLENTKAPVQVKILQHGIHDENLML